MALPIGLVPWLVAAVTVGISTTAVLVTHLFARRSETFCPALRRGLGMTAVVYLIGTGIVWMASGYLPSVVVALAGVGVGTAVLLVGLPLVLGSKLLHWNQGYDTGEAYRAVTYGWPVAMLIVFLLFLLLGGTNGSIFSLDGLRTCLAGFCGVSVPLVTSLGGLLIVTAFGPGVIGRLFGLDR